MKSFAVLSTIALSGLATAQDVESKPFKITVHSEDKSIDGFGVGACHSGAITETLCIGRTPGVDFTFSHLKDAPITIKGDGPEGVLRYTLPTCKLLLLRLSQRKSINSKRFIANTSYAAPPLRQTMHFIYEPSTNIATPAFGPAGELYVAFDDNNLLNIITGVDDSTTDPTVFNPRALYDWYVCKTFVGGYHYQALGWVMGGGKPHNPTCIKVDVKRTFD